MISSWPDDFCGSCYLHMEFSSLSDCADSLEFITSVVFKFWIIENCKSAPSEKTDDNSLSSAAFVPTVHEDMKATPTREGSPLLRSGMLNSKVAERDDRTKADVVLCN